MPPSVVACPTVAATILLGRMNAAAFDYSFLKMADALQVSFDVVLPTLSLDYTLYIEYNIKYTFMQMTFVRASFIYGIRYCFYRAIDGHHTSRCVQTVLINT